MSVDRPRWEEGELDTVVVLGRVVRAVSDVVADVERSDDVDSGFLEDLDGGH